MEPPLYPPAEWFDDPQFDEPTEITVDRATGRVYGHIAAWGTCHTGYPGSCLPPPHSTSGYAYFNTGTVETKEGGLLRCGRITMRTGHTDQHVGYAQAIAHYDNTGMAAAVVRAGEDAWGIWHAGALLPHVTEQDVAELRRHPPSGDWRTIAGHHELIGTLCVNVPGYPVVRARVAAGGVTTLLAAGAPQLRALIRERQAARELLDLVARADPAAAMRVLSARARGS
jgi:hypothetical protein